MDERYQAALFPVLAITPCPQNIVEIFGLITITIQKHFPESKNPSKNPKSVLDSGKYFAFLELFLDSNKYFLILGSILDPWNCFWILGRVLDSGKSF